MIGTESYLAPEVKEGAPASERADLYALGVVLADVSREGAAASLWELTDRLRDPDPERRPRSAASALATLERRSTRPGPTTATQPFAVTPEQDTGASGAPPPRPFRRPRPGSRSRQAAHDDRVIAVGLLLVALIIGLVLGSGGDDSSPPVDVRERGDGAQSQSSGDGGQSATAPTQPEDTSDSSAAPAARPRSRTIPGPPRPATARHSTTRGSRSTRTVATRRPSRCSRTRWLRSRVATRRSTTTRSTTSALPISAPAGPRTRSRCSSSECSSTTDSSARSRRRSTRPMPPPARHLLTPRRRGAGGREAGQGPEEGEERAAALRGGRGLAPSAWADEGPAGGALRSPAAQIRRPDARVQRLDRAGRAGRLAARRGVPERPSNSDQEGKENKDVD